MRSTSPSTAPRRFRSRPDRLPRETATESRPAAPAVGSVATALPPHRVDQRSAKAFAATRFAGALGAAEQRLLEVFDHSGIESRPLCMPLEWYERPHDFGETNALYVHHARALSVDVAHRALEAAALSARDVDHVVFVSSTGIATPSVDALLANELGFRSDVRRTPIWGLGCAGGVAGLSRARDFALADPEARVLLIAVELCSLTFQHRDRDRRNLVATSLFADGAAAVVVTGARVRLGPPHDARPSPGATAIRGVEIVAARSTLWPHTLDVMGWTVDDSGLHVVFSRDIPTFVRRHVRPDLESFLAAQGLGLESITHWIAHPGGPKVLGAYAAALGLSGDPFRHAREVLRVCGNMSSPTCLFVLERALAADGIGPGGIAVVAALGPGFSSEYALLRGYS